jgi:hypothetical protein
MKLRTLVSGLDLWNLRLGLKNLEFGFGLGDLRFAIYKLDLPKFYFRPYEFIGS